jgi:hypothetical protein
MPRALAFDRGAARARISDFCLPSLTRSGAMAIKWLQNSVKDLMPQEGFEPPT